MSAKFYTLLTDIGAAKLANAAALGVPLKITQMAVGDGGGALPTPNAQQTKLVGEKRRAALNTLYIDPQNSSQVIAEQVIPEREGGWWIREVGLFDETGALIAVGNCPESYKPQLEEGSGRTQTVRMVLITSSTDNITLKIDPSVVLATRKYVDDKVLELMVYVDELMAAHLAAADPHSQYAPKASPTFTGTPKAPTATAGNNSTQLANTAFVQAAITALVDSSPEALNTLNELAEALGNDPNFATTVTNALARKQPLDSTLSDLSGRNAEGILQYLGFADGIPGRLIGCRSFIASGIYTPSSVVKNVRVFVTGGGGSGTGTPGAGFRGAGGGGGGTAIKYLSIDKLNYQITVGKGGMAGNDGGHSSFDNLVTATGGGGAQGINGGDGGVGEGGDINIIGGCGSDAPGDSTLPTGGGGSGHGGGSYWGGGQKSISQRYYYAVSSAPGGGGGGNTSAGGADVQPGTDGIVYIEEYT
ncbi:phage tail protein [Enterobacter ludwigii]|uniref:phage tail protein n=1 Tax=Enterobacter ludwigii TaxID=299767 RepID=UPI003EF6B84E